MVATFWAPASQRRPWLLLTRTGATFVDHAGPADGWGAERMPYPDVICAFHRPCNLLELLDQVVAGLVDALLQGDGVGACCHSLRHGHTPASSFGAQGMTYTRAAAATCSTPVSGPHIDDSLKAGTPLAHTEKPQSMWRQE